MAIHNLSVEIIELEQDNYHLMLSSNFQNGDSGHWIIDTGASKTVFDKTLTDQYNIIDVENDAEMQSAGLGEDYIDTEVGEIPMVSFNGFHTQQLKVALIDLTHINNLYEKYSDLKICGLIGSDFLYKYKAIINYSEKMLTLYVEE